MNEVLAYYSIRSKQEYIYRTNRLCEIGGGSEIIKDAFKLLTDSSAIYVPKTPTEEFSITATREMLKDEYEGVVVFEGGGNLTVLYRNRDVCINHNKRFSMTLLRETYSLTPLCCYVDVNLDENNYMSDYGRLMACASGVKRNEPPLMPMSAMSFSKVNRNTWQPITVAKPVPYSAKKVQDFTYEALKKQEKYQKTSSVKKDEEKAVMLDDMVWDEGSESLLAIVYADGNNMGRKFDGLLSGLTTYDDCINRLRNYSEKTNNQFVERGKAAITEYLIQKRAEESEKKRTDPNYKSKKDAYSWRPVLAGGDEITFICNARVALKLARLYLDTVNTNGFSASAGIAVFHHHYPVAAAYKVAEAACENAKKRAKNAASNDKDLKGYEISMIDFQFIHSGADVNLDVVRAETQSSMARPYVVGIYDSNGTHVDRKLEGVSRLDDLIKLNDAFPVVRSAVKELGQAVSKGIHNAHISLSRIISNNPSFGVKLDEISKDREYINKLMYDYSEFYDYWFAKEHSAKGGTK